jgi:hypothetical protein
MATLSGKQLAQNVRQKIEDLKKVCEGVDENTTSRAPKDDGLPRKSFLTYRDPKARAICRASRVIKLEI